MVLLGVLSTAGRRQAMPEVSKEFICCLYDKGAGSVNIVNDGTRSKDLATNRLIDGSPATTGGVIVPCLGAHDRLVMSRMRWPTLLTRPTQPERTSTMVDLVSRL